MPKLSRETLAFARTAINASKLSIEMFNRVEPIHWKESVLMLNAQSWELILKANLVKRKISIYETDGKTITAEKALNKSIGLYNLISEDQAKTIAQIISLRNEATHGLLPKIDDEIMTHLIYFSVTAFNEFIKKEFQSLKYSFEKNYLSIALGNHTFYSNKVEKLFKHSRKKSSEENKLLFLLDRGCEFIDASGAAKMKTKKEWDATIKKMPRKSRVARHLAVYDYINSQDNIRLVPVHVSRGFNAAVNTYPSKSPNSPVLVKKTDPNKDYPHSTGDLARILKKNENFIAIMSKKLGVRANLDYCYPHRVGKVEFPRYSDKALSYLRSFLENNPAYNPYRFIDRTRSKIPKRDTLAATEERRFSTGPRPK